MFRFHSCLLLCLTTGTLFQGCASFFAKQAIEQFAVSLKEQDLEKLKSSTSADFNHKALRQPESVNDLKLLRVPTDSVEVVSVEQVDKTTKKVIVKIGEKERAKEMEYVLTHDRNTGKWVVDDVVLAQQSEGDQTIRRTVSDQMDLLLTCREFLDAWKDGQRADKLAHCEGDLKTELEILPPNWLNVLSERIVGSGRQRTFRPEARMNGEKAVVIVPHPEGNLFLEMTQRDDVWKVHNIAIEPKSGSDTDTGITSLTKLVVAMNTSAKFLASYASNDREGLQATSSDNFFKQCLAAADLETTPLPVPTLLADEYEMRQFKDRMELLLTGPESTYMLTLVQEEGPMVDGIAGKTETRIDEVTIFESDGEVVKKLSAMYLSHAVVNLYLDALTTRNLQQLKEMSTNDFKDRVWDREYARHFAIMNYPNIDQGELEVIATVFRGDLTEVTISKGETAMTFVMRLTDGWMVVDDVLFPALDRPTSLKANLELVLPVRSFAAALQQRNLKAAIRESGDGLDRIVWMQRPDFPQLDYDFVRPLMGEVISIQPVDSWIVVHTSDGETSAAVKLTQEANRYVVHDVTLISEANTAQRLDLMQTMRAQIAASQQPEELRRISVAQAKAKQAEVLSKKHPLSHIQQASYNAIEEPQALEPTYRELEEPETLDPNPQATPLPQKVQKSAFVPLSRDLYAE